MRKIFSILVVLMVISLTFMSCTPATGDTKNGTGSSTGTDTTALENFMNEKIVDKVIKSDNGKVYSGKIKNTNGYVLIPAKAAVPSEFRKVDDKEYSLGNARLIKVGEINIYSYDIDGCYFRFNDGNTIHMSNRMLEDYFNNDTNIDESIIIDGMELRIKY